MRRSWAALTVGALTIVVLGAAFMIFRYTREGLGRGEGYRVWALFDDALGIYERSRVLSAGLEVGQIESMTLDQETGKAKITLRIKPEIRLYENAVISKRAASLIGEFYLDMVPGTPVSRIEGQVRQNRLLKDGDQIVNVAGQAAVTDILDAVGKTIPVLQQILVDVRELTSGQVKDIATNVNNLIEKNSVVLERLLARVDNIAATVEDITQDQEKDIRASIQNVREITEGLKGLVGTASGEVEGAGRDMRGTLQKLQSSVDSLERSLKSVEQVTGKVAQGEGTVGRLVQDDTIARNLETISEDAGGFVRGLARLQTIVGLRSEFNYLAGTFKTYLLVQIMPRPDKFYLLEVVDDPRGYRETTRIQGNSSERGVYFDEQSKISEKLRISFMFGKRIGPFTGRFGVKESTGGLGGDVHLLNDRLMLSVDVFDTRSNQALPRVTGRAIYAVYKRYLHLIAGVDDVLNQGNRQNGIGGGFGFDWFFGAQLQFNDEDLKSLLLFGGGGAAAAAGR